MGLSVDCDSCDDDGGGGGEGGWEWVDGFVSLRDESESVCGRQAGSERSRRDQPGTLVSSPTQKEQKLTRSISTMEALFTCDSRFYQQMTMQFTMAAAKAPAKRTDSNSGNYDGSLPSNGKAYLSSTKKSGHREKHLNEWALHDLERYEYASDEAGRRDEVRKAQSEMPAVIKDKQSKPRKKYHRVALILDHSSLQIK
jgi:hypothetical protein